MSHFSLNKPDRYGKKDIYKPTAAKPCLYKSKPETDLYKSDDSHNRNFKSEDDDLQSEAVLCPDQPADHICKKA